MGNIATRQAYGEALAEIANENKNLVVLDADLSKSTKTAEFKAVCPERFFNMGISEGDMITTAAGLATCGKTVFASSFAMFAAGRAYEQIRNSVAYPKLNVKVAATHAGISVGEDGASHQCVEDLALMRVIPNMTVFSPADDVEAREIIKYAAKTEGPMYIRLSRMGNDRIFDEKNYEFNFGKGIEVKSGKDITIVSTGILVAESLKAAEILSEKGIDARVININTIKPMDKNILVKASKETKSIVTVEEHNIIGGLGSAVLEAISETAPTKVYKIGMDDTFGRSGTPKELLDYYGLTAEKIAKNILDNFIG
ncbi:MAG: transketolase family protein [Clostridia bacterium]|jgi:transketolase|nr:transketolase family protein [Clostridia bacterium]